MSGDEPDKGLSNLYRGVRVRGTGGKIELDGIDIGRVIDWDLWMQPDIIGHGLIRSTLSEPAAPPPISQFTSLRTDILYKARVADRRCAVVLKNIESQAGEVSAYRRAISRAISRSCNGLSMKRKVAIRQDLYNLDLSVCLKYLKELADRGYPKRRAIDCHVAPIRSRRQRSRERLA